MGSECDPQIPVFHHLMKHKWLWQMVRKMYQINTCSAAMDDRNPTDRDLNMCLFFSYKSKDGSRQSRAVTVVKKREVSKHPGSFFLFHYPSHEDFIFMFSEWLLFLLASFQLSGQDEEGRSFPCKAFTFYLWMDSFLKTSGYFSFPIPCHWEVGKSSVLVFVLLQYRKIG